MRTLTNSLLMLFQLACLVLLPATTRADIVFIAGATTPAEEGIRINEPGLISSGLTVQGRTTVTEQVLNFTSGGGGIMTVMFGGQPAVHGVEAPFVDLTIRFADPSLSFTELDFVLDPLVTLTTSVRLTATDTGGQVFTSPVFPTMTPGMYPFSVEARDGQRISSVRISAILIRVRGIRIGGVGRGGTVTPVPEPATLVLLGMGLAGVAAAARRKRKVKKSQDE